ncbi:MAG TPA: type II toxin-antitoxin system RelE/ParE family toxin, partial [Dyadobacter sp.]|nr:type II toxin-antitoxin system RelE/ParE family toxin [Dyadobacter sp.]
MIKNFLHKGLEQYYTEGSGSKLPPAYLRKINRILDQLDAISSVKDIQQMGSGMHKLSGNLSDFWSVTITPDYRIIFRFEDGDILDVDYILT